MHSSQESDFINAIIYLEAIESVCQLLADFSS